MTPDRAANNRVLAEWVGWKCLKNSDDELQWHHPACSCVAMRPEDPCACHDGCYWFDGEDVPDFYESEAANAMLRDKGNLRIEPMWCGFQRTGWQAIPLDENGLAYKFTGVGLTAMEAAVNAVLALINQEK